MVPVISVHSRSRSWFFLVAVPLVLIAFACARRESPAGVDPWASTRAPPAMTRAGPGPHLETWASDPPKSWTDPRVVAALSDDCGFSLFLPSASSDPQAAKEPEILMCSIVYRRTPDVGPCAGAARGCETRCDAACNGCGGGCVEACTACKAGCKDHACKTACATRCAGCKQSCMSTMDGCMHDGCKKMHDACTAQLTAQRQSSGCKARCAAIDACESVCASAKDPYEGIPHLQGSRAAECKGRCRRQVSPAFDACGVRCASLLDKREEHALCVLECHKTAPCAVSLCGQGRD